MTQGDEHVIEAAGRARVVVRDGHVVSVGPARITFCPLAARFSEPVRTFSEEEIKRNIEGRIAAFGMCTPGRVVVSDDDFVLFHLLSGVVSLMQRLLPVTGQGRLLRHHPVLSRELGGRCPGWYRQHQFLP